MAWMPRASSLGFYWACSYRAALDRVLHDSPELATPELQAIKVAQQAPKPSPYADFGTLVHWELQTGAGCVFDDGATAPTTEQLACASTLFNGDEAATRLAVRTCAQKAFTALPASPAGEPWRAEVVVKSKAFTGHIDFLSRDSSVIVDLKTRAKPVLGGRPDFKHGVQLAAYASLTGAKTGVLLYVGMKADWVWPYTIDFTSPEWADVVEHVDQFTKYLISPALYETARPQIGQHCTDSWCPYVSVCRDKLIPPTEAPEQGAVPSMKGFLS